MTRTITDIRHVGIAPNLTLIADVKEDGCLLGYSVTIDKLTAEELTAYAVIEAAELEQEQHRVLKIVLDVTAPKPEQTYQEFQSIAAKYAPKPFTQKANCQHEHEYATINGMFCRDCHQTREAVTAFEKRLVSKLTPRNNGYVNYGMR